MSIITYKKIIKFVIQTVIPFFIPFLFEIPKEHISDEAQWIIFIIIAISDLILIFTIEKRQQDEKRDIDKNEMIRETYSNVYELSERKRNYLVEQSYITGYSLNENGIPYNVHEYIGEICQSFKNVISQITNISNEYVSVSFIYRYIFENATNDEHAWKWIVGREQTMRTPLNEFVEKRNTVYYKLINDTENTFLFYNDKVTESDKGNYYLSARDRRHNMVGSIFGVQLMFSNNAQSFVEGILIVSTYGKRFVDNNENEIKKLNQLIVDDIFPYYQRLLETELGVLYFRHKGESNIQKTCN